MRIKTGVLVVIMAVVLEVVQSATRLVRRALTDQRQLKITPSHF